MAEDGQEKKETVTISGVPVRTLRQFCFDKAAEFFKNDPDMIKLAREEINNMTEMERTCFHFDIQNEEEARGFLMFDGTQLDMQLQTTDLW